MADDDDTHEKMERPSSRTTTITLVILVRHVVNLLVA
jgi:hypothetical protein